MVNEVVNGSGSLLCQIRLLSLSPRWPRTWRHMKSKISDESGLSKLAACATFRVLDRE